ncbi:MAG: hypothetical protein ACRCU5_13875 [Rhizobiaceae bacterium]
MKNLIERYLPNFNTAPGEGGGGAPAVTDPAAPAGAAAPEGGPGAASPAAPAGAAVPDWLAKVPEQFRGKDAEETVTKQLEALEGYRNRDAARKVPEAPEAYAAFDFEKVDASIRPQLESLAKDPLFAEVSKVALERKISTDDLHALTTALYGAGAKSGLFADMIDPVAERAALLPAGYENKPEAEQAAAIDARLKANEDFVNLLVKNSLDDKGNVKAGGLAKADADNLMFWLGSDAAGNRALEFMRSQMQGGNTGPLLGGQSGAGDTREGLRAEMEKPENKPGHPDFSLEKHAALQARYQAMFKD